MILCPICNTTIIKDQEIAVIAAPLKCQSTFGEYSYIPDFVRNEKVLHYSCLLKKFPDLQQITLDKTFVPPKVQTSSELVNELRETLKSMGEYVSVEVLESFIGQYGDNNEMHGLISLWFKNRKVFN